MLGLQSLSSFELGQRRSLTLENCTTAIDRSRSLLPLCWNMLGNARGTQPKQRKRIIMQGGRYIHSTSPTRGRDKGLVWFQIFIIVYHKGGIEKCHLSIWMLAHWSGSELRTWRLWLAHQLVLLALLEDLFTLLYSCSCLCDMLLLWVLIKSCCCGEGLVGLLLCHS